MPAKPIRAQPSTNTLILNRFVFFPSDWAASSSSRIALRTRPNGDRLGPLDEPIEPDQDEHEHDRIDQRPRLRRPKSEQGVREVDERGERLELEDDVHRIAVVSSETATAAGPQFGPENAELLGHTRGEPQPDDLREGDRRDREVVGPEAQRGDRDDEARQAGGDDAAGDRDRHREPEPRVLCGAGRSTGFASIIVTYRPIAMNPATPMLNRPVYPQWRFSASVTIP